MNSPAQLPWYKRSIKPAWLPEWLGVCLLVALGFAVGFSLFLDQENAWLVALFAGLGGFAFGIILVSIISVRWTVSAQESRRLTPPDIVRWPVLTAVLTATPVDWIIQRKVYIPKRRGKVELLFGEPAVVFAIVGLGILALAIGALVLHRYRTTGRVSASSVVSLLVATAAAVFGVVRASADLARRT